MVGLFGFDYRSYCGRSVQVVTRTHTELKEGSTQYIPPYELDEIAIPHVDPFIIGHAYFKVAFM